MCICVHRWSLIPATWQLLGAGGRVTVLCTYASLPVITAAHRDHGHRRGIW